MQGSLQPKTLSIHNNKIDAHLSFSPETPIASATYACIHIHTCIAGCAAKPKTQHLCTCMHIQFCIAYFIAYTCERTHTYTHTHTHTRAHTHTHTHTRTHTHTHRVCNPNTHTHAWSHAHAHTYKCTNEAHLLRVPGVHANGSDFRFMATQGLHQLACSYTVHFHVIIASSGKISAAQSERSVLKATQLCSTVLCGAHVRCIFIPRTVGEH